MDKPVILKQHHSDRMGFRTYDVIAYKDCVMTATWNLWNWKKLTKAQLDKKLEEVKMSQEQWQQVLDAIEAGQGNTDTSEDLDAFAMRYVKEVGIDEQMRQIILNHEETSKPYEWYRVVDPTDKEMRQRVIDDNDPKYAWMFLVAIDDNDEDMRQILLKTRDAYWLESYCYCVRHDEEMYQTLLDIKDPCTAITWCKDFGIDPKMRQIILDSGDSKWAYEYCAEIDRKDSEMRELAKGY